VVTLGFTIPWAHDRNDSDNAPIVLSGVLIDAFPPCSSNIPFLTGAPTCDPPFYTAPA
jgi:hypothetical protein